MSEVEVKEKIEIVAEEKRIELELVKKRRDKELLAYLREAHDREAQSAVCKYMVPEMPEDPGSGVMGPARPCLKGPFLTWQDLVAHMRAHHVMDGGDDRIASKALKDTDNLIHPPEELKFRVSLPGGRDEVAKQVIGGLQRYLASSVEDDHDDSGKKDIPLESQTPESEED